jgi:hypothetical protein
MGAETHESLHRHAKCPLLLSVKGKVIPINAMEAHGVRGGIAPTHS